jgi:hypothetical protein
MCVHVPALCLCQELDMLKHLLVMQGAQNKLLMPEQHVRVLADQG